MSNYNMILGSAPIPNESVSKLQFHQYTIYDSENWLQDGYLCWNASLKEFFVQPFVPVPPSEVLAEESVPVNSMKNTPKKKLSDLKKRN